MKAHINGIEVEGTPQEIMEFKRLQDREEAYKPMDRLSKMSESIMILSETLGRGTG